MSDTSANSAAGSAAALTQVARLRDIVAKLRAPDGCPWDREQTHASLRAGAIEEVYEMVEAIDAGDDPHFREELGDLLLQVIMHAQIAAEEGRFTLEDVACEVAEKLVRRHPHVFGENRLADSDAVLQQWDEIKKAERASKGAPADASALDGVSNALPALMRAEKMQRRAARVGFDWDALHAVVEKIREEVAEVEAEIAGGDRARLEDELGDLLFSVVNLTRKAKFEAEILLNQATNKFVRRFHAMEAEASAAGKALPGLSLAEMDAIWDRVKGGE
ncbi:MAG TPA: nucleoside triphosphate pyrophosphohydrolase [Chthoniobacteraceae bacterium]|nr:nucleoside triphosphate pyrophosphohydrolase [Chthoniobacteraceae bacterium]